MTFANVLPLIRAQLKNAEHSTVVWQVKVNETTATLRYAIDERNRQQAIAAECRSVIALLEGADQT